MTIITYSNISMTERSERTKPLLVFDVDGVILNFSKGFAEYFNAKHPHLNLAHNPEEWDYGLTGTDLNLLKDNIKSFIDEGYHLELLHEDMPNSVNDAHNRFDVQIVTSFHNHSSRVSNLEKFSIKYNRIVFSDNTNKVDILKQLGPKLIVEDCPMHVERIQRELPDAVVFVPDMWRYTQSVVGERVIKYQDPKHLYELLHEHADRMDL